jgi:hypothetical protein
MSDTPANRSSNDISATSLELFAWAIEHSQAMPDDVKEFTSKYSIPQIEDAFDEFLQKDEGKAVGLIWALRILLKERFTWRKGLEWASKALKLLDHIGTKPLEQVKHYAGSIDKAQADLMLAQVVFLMLSDKKQNNKKLQKLLEETLELYDGIEDNGGSHKALYAYGMLKRNIAMDMWNAQKDATGLFHDAISVFSRSLQYLEKLPASEQVTKEKIATLQQVANCNLSLNRFDDAEETLELCKQLYASLEQPDIRYLAWTIYYIAENALAQGDTFLKNGKLDDARVSYTKAKKAYLEALQFRDDLSDQLLIAISLGELTEIAKDQSVVSLPEAQSYYDDGYALASLKHPQLKAYFENDLRPTLFGETVKIKSASKLPNISDTSWNQNKVYAVTNALLACPCMETKEKRTDVIRELGDLRHDIKRRNDNRSDVKNILECCLKYENGLQTLMQAIRFYEGDSLPLKNLQAII